MLRTLNELENYAIRALDGDVGHVRDLYFDDEVWVIRYFIVDTGTWLSDRKVLISPFAIGHPDWGNKKLPVSITKEQLRNGPDIDTEKPVSRQQEMQYLGYYGYPFYWDGAGLWGEGIYPNMMMPGASGFVSAPFAGRSEAEKADEQAAALRHNDDDPHLRSCKEVVGYHIHAIDGDIGHVQGFLIDEKSWAIRYIIFNTSNWGLGHELLIAPQWIRDVSWTESKVTVNLSRQTIKDAPPYDSTIPLDRNMELGIHNHYGRTGYWANEEKREIELSNY